MIYPNREFDLELNIYRSMFKVFYIICFNAHNSTVADDPKNERREVSDEVEWSGEITPY